MHILWSTKLCDSIKFTHSKDYDKMFFLISSIKEVNMLTYAVGKPLQESDFNDEVLNKIRNHYNNYDVNLNGLQHLSIMGENLEEQHISHPELMKQKVGFIQQQLISKVNTNLRLNDNEKNKLIREILTELYNEEMKEEGIFCSSLFAFFVTGMSYGAYKCATKNAQEPNSCDGSDIFLVTGYTFFTLLILPFLIHSRSRASKFASDVGFNKWAHGNGSGRCLQNLTNFNEFDKKLFFSPVKSSLFVFSKPETHISLDGYSEIMADIMFKMSQFSVENTTANHNEFQIQANQLADSIKNLDDQGKKDRLLNLKTTWIAFINESQNLTIEKKDIFLKLLTSNPKKSFKSLMQIIFTSLSVVSFILACKNYRLAQDVSDGSVRNETLGVGINNQTSSVNSNDEVLAADLMRYFYVSIAATLINCIMAKNCYIPQEITSDSGAYKIWLENFNNNLQPSNRCRMRS